MSLEMTTSPAPSFQDRIGGLIAVGTVLVLLGLVCLLFAFLLLIAAKISTTAGNDTAGALSPGAALATFGTYGVACILFVWLGIGTLLARRWARAIMLVLSILWLAGGLSSLLMVALAFLSGRANLLDAYPVEFRKTLTIVFAVSGAVMVVLYVVFPLIFTLFLRKQDVKATCEARDPKPRWTDRCPLPVLGLAVAMLGFAAYALGMALYPVLPFFGRLLTGREAVALQACSAVLFLLAAVQLYRLKLLGWWLAGILVLAMCISTIVTFQMVGPASWFDAMQVPADRRPPEAFYAPFFSQLGAWTAMWACIAAGYLLYVKRYFVGRGSDEAGAPVG